MAVEGRLRPETAGAAVVAASVAPQDLARAVAGCVSGGGRFLHLCEVPPQRLLAVCDTPAGVRAWSADRTGAGEAPLPRPSSQGVLAALHAEAGLAAAGVRWATPQPEVGVHGRGVFTLPLGPVRANVAESAAWRLFVMGDEVLGLHLGFGYKVRHVEAAMTAAGARDGVAVAERVTGTSPVAHATAYCQAWEAALGGEAGTEAQFWRGVLAELERLHSHLGDLAALASSTGLPVAAAELWSLREGVLRACADLCGNRYMRGTQAVGGLAQPLSLPAARQLPGRLQALARRLGDIVRALDASTSFLDRLHGTGRIPAPAAAAFQPVGPVGRAAGLAYDVRRDRPYGAYRSAAPAVALERRADAWARYRVRVFELEATLAWLSGRLEAVPAGRQAGGRPAGRTPAGASPEVFHVGRVEAPRGELLYFVGADTRGGGPWVRLRPPSAVDWLVVPYAVPENNVLQDVPIIDASFALSVAAMDR